MITTWSHHQTGDNLPQTDPFYILHGMYLSVTETKRRHTKPVCFQSTKCSQRQQIIKMDIRQNGHLSKWTFIKMDIYQTGHFRWSCVWKRVSDISRPTAESCRDWKPCLSRSVQWLLTAMEWHVSSPAVQGAAEHAQPAPPCSLHT